MKQILRYLTIIIVFIPLLIYSCQKENKPTPPDDDNKGKVPVLTTGIISNISQDGAICGGDITSAGTSDVTTMGVCWSTSPTPTIADSKSIYAYPGTSYRVQMSGLTPGTKYYVRAFATNSVGTGYGVVVTFTTLSTTIGTITDIDNNIYHTVSIGTLYWMVENLKTTKYNDGTSIQKVIDKTAWASLRAGAYCEYDNNVSNVAIYGRLYNWYAISSKLCPSGWHIATDNEWKALVSHLNGENVAGGSLKESGISHWPSPNTGATNSSGFTALPSGYRDKFGNYVLLGQSGIWWTATESPSSIYTAYFNLIGANAINIYRGLMEKVEGYSLRCVKDI